MRPSSIALVASMSLVVLAQGVGSKSICSQQCILAGASTTCNNCNINGVLTCSNDQCMCSTPAWINQFTTCLLNKCTLDDAYVSTAEFNAICIKEGYEIAPVLRASSSQSNLSATPTSTTVLDMATPTTTATSKATPSPSSVTSPITSATSGPLTNTPAPIVPAVAQTSGLRSSTKAAIALGIVLLVGALAIGALLLLRRHRKSTLPRGTQPRLPLDTDAQTGNGQAESVPPEKSYIRSYSAPAVVVPKEVAGTAHPVEIQIEKIQSPTPQYQSEPRASDTYFLQMPSEHPARKASPRPVLISREFITPTNTNGAGMSANTTPAPYVWTRGRTLSRDAV